MSDINTVFTYFETRNHTGNISTSGYALPFCFFSFLPRLETTTATSISNSTRFSNKRIVWDYGDGTSSEATTGRHSYSQPGRYKVTCYLYDRGGESYYDTFTQSVDVLDYVQNFITLSASSLQGYTLTAGKITNPILITRSTSRQYYGDDITKPLSIVSYISGSTSPDYFYLEDKHYSHLFPTHSTYLLLTGSSNETEFVEISSFNIDGTAIYTKLSGGEVVETDKDDNEGVFSGSEGTTLIYTKDDFTSTGLNVFFGYESNTLKPISNTSTIGFKASVVENTDLHKLSITSNGMDGEGFTTSSFNIGKNKFSNSKIGFVVKVKDSQDFTIRDLPLLENINIILTDGVINYSATVYSNFESLSTLNSGGFFKGYIIADIPHVTENLFLSANSIINGRFLTGTSDTFNVYPSGGYYNIAKKGEDIDLKEQFKSIAFQPLFLDKKVLFDDFLGSIFGDINSSQSSIGKKTYEKITNFVDNNSIIDYSNLDQLVSILKLLNEDSVSLNTSNAITPSEVGRLLDLLSINHSRLFGTKNQFNENFKSYGYLNNELYGKNLGEEVSIYHTVTAGFDIVAFEKYSGNYCLLNTYLPLCASTVTVSAGNTYNLFEYNETWGWGLVLPNDEYGSGVNISNYYLFYKYIPTIDGTIADGVINFNDVNSTLSYTTSSYQGWSQENGIISNILSHQIYKGLNLFE